MKNAHVRGLVLPVSDATESPQTPAMTLSDIPFDRLVKVTAKMALGPRRMKGYWRNSVRPSPDGGRIR